MDDSLDSCEHHDNDPDGKHVSKHDLEWAAGDTIELTLNCELHTLTARN